MQAGVIMNRRLLLRCLGLLATVPLYAAAQPRGKMYRIGFLRRTSREPAAFEAFRLGLRDLGYGGNVIVEERYAEGEADRLPKLAAELIQSKVDVIVVDGTPTALAVKALTTAVPVVFVLSREPVFYGLVASFSRPGGNFTGLTLEVSGQELVGKRVELLKAAIPRLSRLAALGNPTSQITSRLRAEAERAARTLGLNFQIFEVALPEDLASAYAAMLGWSANGLITLNDAMFFSQRRRIVELAIEHRLPAIHPETEFTEAGGLMSYGPDFHYLFRRAAFYVDKILQGAKPGDLPVEQPTKFQFVINVRTASTMGLTIDPLTLLRADTVIR
jgi:putative tryptophan/tyrosine transport system substrate-binding protein